MEDTVNRAKTVGPPQLQEAYITSELEVRIVKRYMECLQLGSESRNSKEVHLEKNHDPPGRSNILLTGDILSSLAHT